MPATDQTSPHPLLDALHQSLNHVLTFLNQKWEDLPLTLTLSTSPSKNAGRRSFQLEGPAGVSVQIRFAVFLLGDKTYEIYVEIEDGPTGRFTHNPDAGPASTETAPLERAVTEFLLREIEPRLGQGSMPTPTSSEESPLVPWLRLDRDGLIQEANPAARRVLELAPGEELQPNFFSYVHAKNLRHVMRDLSHMVDRGMQRTRWLLRLRTGNDRWRWYRAVARNRLRAKGTILLHLHPFDQAR